MYPFAEDPIVDRAGVADPMLPMLAKVSCLVDDLKMGGSYEPVQTLWAQFVLTAELVNAEVVWTRDEVVVSSVNFRHHLVSFQTCILF